ncbi:DUF3168 domain-containing protein [Tardiphaga sp. vice352]|uniref:DUF3168 domain-containing protein n=1 Tax=Tardiphaga sp. vice352 TaxID=2592816 RepID=UPI001164C227|nr:DUF3168 domain-containing protein [Tardiphaga sp. vice352]QDM32709.1 DUF3168 domain-containing protein [Tardiphaga sp. vice352]
MASEPSFALQQAVGARLAASAGVTALVPANGICDRSGRPELDRCIIIGEGQSVYDDFYGTAYATLHLWTKEPGLATSKEIAGACRAALKDRPWSLAGFTTHDLRVTNTHFMRDPQGEYSHGVVTVRAIVQERAS